MEYKIISDSASDIFELDGVNYQSVPLKIITGENEYVDDMSLDVDKMIDDLRKYKGKSKSSCPNMDEWKTAFEDSENVFCVTITSGLSGSCNAATLALNDYLSENENKRGMVIDTLSAGPEIALIIEKLKELINSKLKFDEICEKINEYKSKTHLVFALESLRNLANNGRVNVAVAKIAGVLGIRVVGKANNEGTLEVVSKVRGREKTLGEIFKNMLSNGYEGGKVRIHHCQNFDGAKDLAKMIKDKFKNAMVTIDKTGALCSFYAEANGLLIGFEGAVKA